VELIWLSRTHSYISKRTLCNIYGQVNLLSVLRVQVASFIRNIMLSVFRVQVIYFV